MGYYPKLPRAPKGRGEIFRLLLQNEPGISPATSPDCCLGREAEVPTRPGAQYRFAWTAATGRHGGGERHEAGPHVTQKVYVPPKGVSAGQARIG